MKINHFARNGYAIGIVLYHPEGSILKRIDQMVKLGFCVYVFDNSPFDSQFAHIIQANENIYYLSAGKNVGLGFSLSTICATAYLHGHRQLLFLDQDTGISEQTLAFIDAFLKTHPTGIRQHYAALVFSGHPSDEKLIEDVRLAISSGSLFNLAVLKSIGWHNENYFVDCVDYEFCVRARRYGFKVGLIKNTPDFDHVTEQPDRKISIFGSQVLVRCYSATRIKDALGAYLKLIIGDCRKNSLCDTYALSRSAGLYIFGQIIARLVNNKI